MSDDIVQAQDSQVRHLLETVCHIASAHQSAKDLYVHRFAPDFNAFDFIEPDEARLSKILAWLLDPRQNHGQGCQFLRLFLDALGVNVGIDECDHAEVRTEVFITQGRLDILISTIDLRVAVENKPWAGDQEAQLARYFAHFDTCGTSNCIVIYLTSKGAVPPEYSISEQERDRRIKAQQLRLWSYDKEILGWLARCRADCRADRVVMFIDDFSRYIRAVFEGMRDRTMSDHILNEIAASADNVAGAMQVISLADALQKRLLGDLRQQLLTRLRNHDVELVDDPWTRYSGFTISYSETSPYKFGFEFQNTQFNGLVIGISRKIENDQARGNEYESLVSAFGGASQSEWWLWWRSASPTDSLLPVPRDWQASTQPWVDIPNQSLAARIEEAFTRTHSVLTACGVG